MEEAVTITKPTVTVGLPAISIYILGGPAAQVTMGTYNPTAPQGDIRTKDQALVRQLNA